MRRKRHMPLPEKRELRRPAAWPCRTEDPAARGMTHIASHIFFWKLEDRTERCRSLQ